MIGRPSVTFTPSIEIQRLERDQRLIVIHRQIAASYPLRAEA